MKTFKQYIEPEEFIAFSNAGGPLGQYDKFDYSESKLYGCGGGAPEKESVDENLNTRINPQYINTRSQILFDPEKDNKGLGEDKNSPENIGIPDHFWTGRILPRKK